jgi:acyl-coenzyme A thioesterase PaaI-like protein
VGLIDCDEYIHLEATDKMTSEEQQERVRSSFAKQGLMTTLGATLGSVSPGMVEVALSRHPAISQQHGFVHAGAVSAIADSAAGYAALSLMPADTGVNTFLLRLSGGLGYHYQSGGSRIIGQCSSAGQNKI